MKLFKNQIIKISLSCFILMFSTALLAAPTASQNLIKIFNNISTIKADFKQDVMDNSGRIISTSTGTMIIQRPNRFRWDTQTPMQQLAIADGEHVWLYQPDLEQVTISKMNHEIGQTPLAILSGSTDSLQKNFSIAQPSAHEFVLTSLKNSVPFHQITLVFDNHDRLQQMQLKDELGQTTVLSFTHLQLNPTVNKNSFSFTPPKGVDIIHNA